MRILGLAFSLFPLRVAIGIIRTRVGLSVGGLFGYGAVWCGYEGYGVVVDMVDMVGMVGMVTPIHRTELIERFFWRRCPLLFTPFFCCCFPLFLEKSFFDWFWGEVRHNA